MPGTEFEGQITAVFPAADPKSRVFNVEVTIPNPKGLLQPGMIVRSEWDGQRLCKRSRACPECDREIHDRPERLCRFHFGGARRTPNRKDSRCEAGRDLRKYDCRECGSKGGRSRHHDRRHTG